MATMTFSERSVIAERALVRRLWPELQWRRHGIGVLQAYVSEGSPEEVRVHVWHPLMIRTGIINHGDIHDHRFRLTSTVLHGTIGHLEVIAEPDPDGDWDVLQVKHARINPEGSMARPFGAVVPGPLVSTAERVRIVNQSGVALSRGATYTFERGHFHRSVVHGLAITLVTKDQQIDAGARILSRRDRPAVAAFDPDDVDDPKLQAINCEVLAEAFEALRRADKGGRP